MPYIGALLGAAAALLWLFCLIDIITTTDEACNALPRFGWLILVLLVPLIGALLWLMIGRPRPVGSGHRVFERPAPSYPEYDRPGRFAAVDEDADAEFLRRCRERAEEQRRKARGETDG